jgi:hypothetical protein
MYPGEAHPAVGVPDVERENRKVSVVKSDELGGSTPQRGGSARFPNQANTE